MSAQHPSADPHESESHTTFFRQGSWLIVATVSGGVFNTATQVVAQRWMEPAEYVVFFALLRIFLLLGIPSTGLQTVFAQQTASAVLQDQQRVLAATFRSILGAAFGLWCLIALVAFLGQGRWMAELKVQNPAALWATVGIGLSSLCLPVLRGVLQGRQRFAGLGWILILDGLGRFLAVTLIVLVGGQAAGGMFGAWFGQVIALGIGVWLLRDLLRAPGAGFHWRPWLRRVIPQTLGTGAVVFIANADVVYVQNLFRTEQTTLYVPAAMIGLALVSFTMPLAAVMFPKVARSAALTRGTHAVQLALVATALMAAAAALACTLLPELPLRIIFFGKPLYWAAAPLVPWFAWALVPLILGNVLLGNLLARERFSVVPWIVLLAVAYGFTLWWLRPHLLAEENPFTAFRTILLTLGLCNVGLLAVTACFTFREKLPVVEAAPAA